jgi:hypothetical protein
MNTDNPLIGRRVLNIHRQDFDMPQSYRDSYKGTVVGVLEGCNTVVVVQFDGGVHISHVAVQDLAFCELWPNDGCRVNYQNKSAFY